MKKSTLVFGLVMVSLIGCTSSPPIDPDPIDSASIVVNPEDLDQYWEVQKKVPPVKRLKASLDVGSDFDDVDWHEIAGKRMKACGLHLFPHDNDFRIVAMSAYVGAVEQVRGAGALHHHRAGPGPAMAGPGPAWW